MEEVKQSKGKVFLGLILLAGGVLALINKLDIPIPEWIDRLFTWELILIIIGLYQLLKKEFTSGIVLLVIGTYFKFMEWKEWRDFFWPLFAIAAGLIILLNSAKTKRKAKASSSKDRVDLVSIFGSGTKVVNTLNFKGGDIVSFFGGSVVNLKESELHENGASMEVVSIFGGTTILVPSDWDVDLTVTSIFGGFKDSREFNNISQNSNKKLVIKGVSIFGGGEIKTS